MEIELTDVERELLEVLYRGQFLLPSAKAVDLVSWCAERGLTTVEAEGIHRRLYDQLGLIVSRGWVLQPNITSRGIDFVEQKGWCQSIAEHQRRARYSLLNAGLLVWDRDGGAAWSSWGDAMRAGGFTDEDYYGNHPWLTEHGLIEHMTGMFRLTQSGAQYACHLVFFQDLFGRWQALQSLTAPKEVRARGHALEAMLVELAKSEGFSAEKNALAQGEENDVIISQGFDHFIVSCKWEKTPAKTQDLQLLRSRIQERPGSLGLLVSVAGFSRELVTHAGSQSSMGLVLLCGPSDLENLFKGDVRLRDLLQARHMELISYLKATYN